MPMSKALISSPGRSSEGDDGPKWEATQEDFVQALHQFSFRIVAGSTSFLAVRAASAATYQRVTIRPSRSNPVYCVSSRCSPSSRDTNICTRVNANNRNLLSEETTVLQRCSECSYDSIVRVVGDLKNRSVLILSLSNPIHLVLPVNRICGYNTDGDDICRLRRTSKRSISLERNIPFPGKNFLASWGTFRCCCLLRV